jgi:hypothetical protein
MCWALVWPMAVQGNKRDAVLVQSKFQLRLCALTLGVLAGVSACASPTPEARVDTVATLTPRTTLGPSATPCPPFLPPGTQCETGTSEAGAAYFLAKPQQWNGTLILFAHGGPRLGTPQLSETIDDLEKFKVLVAEGYAWAGSTYRRGGYGVRSAAEDMDDLRSIMWRHLLRPELTILHGQSWGANVAAKASELYGLDREGRRTFDGVVLTNGVLAGGTRAYQLRVDLRAVYQYYCNNHPRPTETPYPVWQGLAPGTTMTRADLAARVQECTGVGLPVSERSFGQRARLANILAVLSIQESQLLPNLTWATFTFADMAGRFGGGSTFSNRDVIYRGSTDDVALNAGVPRFDADPQALARLAYDSDLSGLIATPTITLHAINDPVANVSNSHAYRQTIDHAGRAGMLVQVYTDEAEHSRLSAPAYPSVFGAMVSWIKTGDRPTPAQISASCPDYAARTGEPCHFVMRSP